VYNKIGHSRGIFAYEFFFFFFFLDDVVIVVFLAWCYAIVMHIRRWLQMLYLPGTSELAPFKSRFMLQEQHIARVI
jgi:hypothetical protein